MTKTLNIPFVGNHQAPDIFADGASGFFFLNGNLRITLESVRCDHAVDPSPAARVVVGRLVIPVLTAENMAKDILRLLEKQRSQPQQQSSQGTATIQ